MWKAAVSIDAAHREDGLLGAAACLDAQKLSAQVACLDAHRSPGRSDQSGLDPCAALSGSSGSALAGALVELEGSRHMEEARIACNQPEIVQREIVQAPAAIAAERSGSLTPASKEWRR